MIIFQKKIINTIQEYLRLQILWAQSRFRKGKLDGRYHVRNLDQNWPPIPLPSANDNQLAADNIDDYVSDYLSLQTSVYPYVKRIGCIKSTSVTLDFGCGFGTLSAAFVLSGNNNGEYFGYDTNSRAINFCIPAYKDDHNFNFFCPSKDNTTNYITNRRIATAHQAYEQRKKASPSLADIKELLGDKEVTCQFSLSVFTHMWPEDATESLRVFGEFSNRETVFINTWLVLDDFATETVRKGTADRKLPIEVGGVWTYSQLNPLVCTAYPLELLHKVYSDAGQTILNIDFGSWSGRENGVTYQDIVVSMLK